MAPTDKTWTWDVNKGRWENANRQPKEQNKQQGQKEKVDWACVDCDDTTVTYLGNYASDTECRDCHKPKGVCQHMSMETRWWHIKNGTLKSRIESKLEREMRLNEKSDETKQFAKYWKQYRKQSPPNNR